LLGIVVWEENLPSPVRDRIEMHQSLPVMLPYQDAVYRTVPRSVPFFSKVFPELSFYSRFLAITAKAGAKSRSGGYTDAAWCQSSLDVLRALERVGIRFDISGIDHLEALRSPCVVIGNHMSVLETTVLPIVIHPIHRVTFIVKNNLMAYPVFKHVLAARDPIVVDRTNPRQDLKTVLEGGTERLQKGVSVIVFPQTTRTLSFDPRKFNTIGVKLAQRAGVPIVPLALLTDAWGNGKYLKDFGRIDPSRKVYFAFGKPMRIEGRGTAENQAVKEFIAGKLKTWKTG
jgi:1-acyl-sn-glycerol-3-phosphate acyltransferase